tara:strand:+ start:1116 stop:1358 length:243 start_codon:yes stop_codon:yes gene_type:complete
MTTSENPQPHVVDAARTLQHALKNEAARLQKRAEWHQQMVARSQRTIDNCQATIEHHTTQLAAVESAITALRTEYRESLV